MADVKELKVRYSTKVPNAYEVYYEGGGEVPAVLQTAFTDPGTAQKAINLYLANRPTKKATKVKTDDEA